MLEKPQSACFLIADISGYTEFLTKSELDHAQDALQNLFDVQLAHIKYPFVISGFRGDAIFMYVPETNFCEPQTILESLENLYFVFADVLRQMIYNTTCTCRAGTSTRYSFGDDAGKLSDHAWWGGVVGNGNAKNDKFALINGNIVICKEFV